MDEALEPTGHFRWLWQSRFTDEGKRLQQGWRRPGHRELLWRDIPVAIANEPALGLTKERHDDEIVLPS